MAEAEANDKRLKRVEVEPAVAPSEKFDGDVRSEGINYNAETGVNQLRVHFHDGAATHWHYHERGQVLYFVDGEGFAQEQGHEVIECGPGDIIEVPDGTKHIHGAMPDKDAVHIAISQGETIWDHDPRY